MKELTALLIIGAGLVIWLDKQAFGFLSPAGRACTFGIAAAGIIIVMAALCAIPGGPRVRRPKRTPRQPAQARSRGGYR
jgi:hypothetical protein